MDIERIKFRFELDECCDWIVKNHFKRVAVQLKREDLNQSVAIVNYLKEKYFEKVSETVDLYVSQSNTCCVDLLVTQHVSNIDAIIHFGKVCLSKPVIKNQISPPKPILFAFGRPADNPDDFEAAIHMLKVRIIDIQHKNPISRICILYDTNLSEYANKLEELIIDENLRDKIEIAKLFNPAPEWSTTSNHESRLIDNLGKGATLFGQYILDSSIDSYGCAIYLGDRLSIKTTLQCPSKLYKINCYQSDMDAESINTTRLLNKRMALVGRLKDEEELKIGVIITNPLPDVKEVMRQLESYSKARKHTLYFISMIQTIDECKIGNFDLCDAFLVVNSCTCSTILESLVFNRPIINDHEFKLACGFEAEYGRVLWPGSTSHLSEDDLANKRKVSDVSLALIHTRNELLERCSQARANKWSGLAYKAATGGGEDGCAGGGESLVVEEGLSGIASSYSSEPLKKPNDNNDG